MMMVTTTTMMMMLCHQVQGSEMHSRLSPEGVWVYMPDRGVQPRVANSYPSQTKVTMQPCQKTVVKVQPGNAGFAIAHIGQLRLQVHGW